jgi:hypothetical protein
MRDALAGEAQTGLACGRSTLSKKCGLLSAVSSVFFAQYAVLQNAIAGNPEAGDLIRGSGGVRKLRWGLAGRGKRGGVRVIYYLRLRQGQVWMLTLYAKNEAESIPAPVLKKIKEELGGED